MMNQMRVLLVAGFGAVAFGGCATSSVEPEVSLGGETEELSASVCPTMPAGINPDADQTIKAKMNAVGAQVYMCNGVAAGPTWTFVAPQANLLSDSGRLLGTHFIGPTWQDNDGSSVAATKTSGVTVDATAIPWLLLTAKPHAAEECGFFADVTQIQRLSTVGGLAPTTGCDAEHLGAIVQVPYSAEYVFYKTKAKGKVVQCKG